MADPVIHYTFDTDGTNSGSLGSTYDLTIPSLFSIDTSNQLSGSGCLKAIRSDGQDSGHDPNTKFSFPDWTVPSIGFSMSFFIKYPDGYPSGTDPRFFDSSFTNNLNYFSLHHQSSTTIRLFGAGSTNTAFTHSLSLFDGNYHNYVLVFSGTNKKLYIDGVLIEDDNTAGGDFSVGPTMNNFNIGSGHNSNAAVCNGYMDQISLYDYPLSINNVKYRMFTAGMTITQLASLGISISDLISAGITIPILIAGGVTNAQLLAGGVTQIEIDIALTNIKIHNAFTISDGTNSSVFATTDAVYTLTTFAAKLTTDLGYTITAGGFNKDTYRLYLQFPNAVTLTGMPKYIFNIPFSDFSVKAGGQVYLHNVNLDADMTINYEKSAILQAQIGEDIVGTDSNERSSFSVKLNNDGTIFFSSAPYYNSVGRVIAYKYKIPTSTEWSTADIVIKGADASQVTGKFYWTRRGAPIIGNNNLFGENIDIDDAGNFIVIGCRQETINGLSKPGTVRVYQYKIPTSTEWNTANSVMKGTDTTQVTDKYYWTIDGDVMVGDNANEQWGRGVAMNSDGSRICWGTRKNSGRIEVYQRDLNNTSTGWTKLGGTIMREDDGNQGGDVGGFSDGIRLNGVGDIILISDRFYRTASHLQVGKTWVYKYKIPTSTEWGTTNMVMKDGDTNQVTDKLYWTKIGEFIPGHISGTELYGENYCINKTGSRVAFTCRKTDTGGSEGELEVFEYSGSGTTWNQIGDIKGTGEGITGESGLLNNFAGGSIDMDSTGNIIAFSQTDSTVNGVTKPGIIGVAEYKNGNWEYIGNDIIGLNGGDKLGESVSIGGDKIAVGSNRFDGTATDLGMAQIYQIEQQGFTNSATITTGNHFINNFVNTISTGTELPLSFDEPNKRITFDGLTSDISLSITSTDTTVFDTSITEITAAANTLSFISYGQRDLTFSQYNANGITINEFLSNGYTIPQLYENGLIPDWTFDTDANHFAQSYVKDFIDISGSLALRENSSLTVNGNIETKGNITIKNPIMVADLSLNYNMIVDGDISMNGNVTVGDISMNGTVVDCSFTDASIPESAFNGTMPGPDYTQPTILYEKGFDTTADVSMNANVQINNLKMDGNIEFSDGTTMNIYDDNIEVNYSQSEEPGDYFDATVGGTLDPALLGGDKGDQLFCSSNGQYAGLSFGGWNPGNHGSNGVANKQGLFITRDFGATWTHSHLPNPADGTPLYRRHISFQMSSDGKYMICGVHANTTSSTGNDTVIGYSEDYGVTWTTYLSKDAVVGYSTNHYIKSVAINHDGSLMTASLSSPDKSWYSTDKMVTWTEFGQAEGQMMNTTRIINNTVAILTGDAKSYKMYKIESGVVTQIGTFAANNTGSYQCVGAFSRGGLGESDIAFFTSANSNSGGTIKKVTGINTTPVATDMSSIHTNNYTDDRLGVVVSPSGKYVLIGYGIFTLRSTFYTNYPFYLSTDSGENFTNVSPYFFNHTDLRSIAISDAGHFYGLDTSNKRIYRSIYTIFKASTFTSLTINNTLTAASFSTSSDYRIKTDISQLDEKVTLDNIRPVKYLQTLINKPQYGFIAHELQEYYPDLVVGEKDGKEWQKVNYTGLIALLINEIKQLKRELTELENGM